MAQPPCIRSSCIRHRSRGKGKIVKAESKIGFHKGSGGGPLAAIAVGLILASMTAGAGEPRAAQRRPAADNPFNIDFSAVEVRSIHVQGNIYMLVGAGGNVTIQVGDDGVLVIDTQFAPMADKLLAEIRRIAGDRPLRWIINTHGHPDHIGGNESIRAVGHTIVGGNVAQDDPRGQVGATVLAHENVQLNMVKAAGTPMAVKEGDWPTETYIGEGYQFSFNGEAIELIHQPNAHTDGDTMIYFRKSDVLVTGDLYQTETYPLIDKRMGGNFVGLLAALNHMVEITVPLDKQEKGTMVIPGHGRVSDEADVVEYRDMLTAIRTRISDMIQKGMTIDQVKAARPTRDYDGRYGVNLPFWSTAMFLETVYADLKAASTEMN